MALSTLAGKQGITSGFITEICLILVIISAIRASQPNTEPPTQYSDNGYYQQGDGDRENCPDIFQLPDGGKGTCTLSDHCSKVMCTAYPHSSKLFGYDVLTVQANGCHQTVKATVRFQSSQNATKWSHIFEDGEITALPIPYEPNCNTFLKVKLKKHGGKVHFKLVVLLEESPTNPLEGDLDGSKCVYTCQLSRLRCEGVENFNLTPTHMDQFLMPVEKYKCPDFQLPDGNVGTCALSDDCNKVTCTVPPESDLPNLFGFDVLTVQAYGCRQSVKATVNFESSQGVTKWSHTFEDGEKAALPATPAPNLKILLKVELKKNGSKVHFKLVLLFEYNMRNLNATFLEGDLGASQCADDKCINFLPGLKSSGLPARKCNFSHHCSKVKCEVLDSEGGRKLTVGFEANKCKQSLTAKVTIQRTDDLDWSHTLGDGEKAKLPASQFGFGTDASLFVKVKLRETQGNKVNFTVTIVGQLDDEVQPVYELVLLQGELPVSPDHDCSQSGSSSWFSRQSSVVKVAVVGVPWLGFVFMGVFLYCHKRQKLFRFNIGRRNNFAVQPLSNEI